MSGTYGDEHVCMTLGQLANFDDSKGHNRWGADPRHLIEVAFASALPSFLQTQVSTPMQIETRTRPPLSMPPCTGRGKPCQYERRAKPRRDLIARESVPLAQ